MKIELVPLTGNRRRAPSYQTTELTKHS